ncbi:MAG: hypothetical protein FWD47_13485 [Treponema sp.]|nr:hypothetical protein [Treponema sp.]
MKIINWDEFLKTEPPQNSQKTSMTVGIFDGVHRGHQVLLKNVVSYNKDYLPSVVTFRQNQKNKNDSQKDIQTFEQKLSSLENMGIKAAIIADLTETFKRTSGIDFLKILLKHGNIGFFAVGSNFRCGYALDTDVNTIKTFFTERKIPVQIQKEVMEGSQPVSSSRIRKAITSGDIELAQLMLGKNLLKHS